MKHLYIFGCAAYRHIDDQQRKKLDDKAEKLIFVGYSEESKAYRLLDSKTNAIKISRDVHFSDILKKDDSSQFEIIFSKCSSCDEDIENIPDNDSSSSESTHGNEDGPDSEDFISAEEESDSSESELMPLARIPDAAPEAVRRSNRSNKGVPPARYEAILNLVKEDRGLIEAR